ncbi:MAG: hypothetical protein GY862_38715 [Gammaproteobacteria bacterium]|nr:hypothetical protein [Gammaproteobacteria bacterium]
MNKLISSQVACVIILLANACSALPQGSARHSAQSARHAASSVAHGVIGSSKAVSAVASVPLGVSGRIGAVSGQAGTHLSEEALVEEPLPITDETVTAGPPPDKKLQNR